MKAGMRIRSEMIFRSREISKLEQISTAVVARPMPMPFMAAVVTPRVGHIPSISTKVGFSVIRPFRKT